MAKINRELVWIKYGKRCAYCGEVIKYKEMQIDHIHPKNKNGNDDFNNLNPSCRKCNFYKGVFSVDEFRNNIDSLHERLTKIFIVKLALSFGILRLKKPSKLFYFEKQQILNP